MAEISAATAASISEKPQRHPFAIRHPKPVEAKGPTVKFDAHHFKDSILSLPAIDKNGKNRVEGVSPANTVEFSAELVSGLSGFAEGYVQKIIRMQSMAITVGGNQSTEYEAMKNRQATGRSKQNYAEDDYMLEAFSVLKNGTRELKKPEEINAIILKHPQMIQNLMVVAERYARDALAAAGLRAEMRQKGNRTDPDDLSKVIDFPIDQGGINAGVHRLTEWLGSTGKSGERDTGRSNIASVRIAGAAGALGVVSGGALGSLIGGPAGAAEGAAAGLILGPVLTAGIDKLTHDGVRLALVKDNGILAQAKRPDELMRSKYLIGIDAVNPINSTRLGSAMREAVQIIYLRAEYMRGLGVPPEQLDALSEQFLNVPDRRPEETDDSMEIEIYDRFERLGGTRRGILVNSAREFYRRAQEEALVARFEKILISESSVSKSDDVDKLDKAIAGRKEGGEIHKARIEKDKQEQERLQTERASLEESLSKLGKYRESSLSTIKIQNDIDIALSRITKNGNVMPMDETLKALREVSRLVGSSDVIKIPDENGVIVSVSNLAGQENDARTAYGEGIKAISSRQTNESERQYNARFDGEKARLDAILNNEIADINRLRQLVENASAHLRELKTNLSIAESGSASSADITAGMGEISVTDSAERTLTEYGVLETTIENGNYAAILSELHALYAHDPTKGWPTNEDNLPENRILLRRSVIQARANVLERADPTLHTAEADYRNIRTLDLTLEQLTTLSIDEIEKRYQQLNPTGTKAEAEHAQLWARGQARYVEDAIREEIAKIKNLESIQARAMRNTDLSAEIAELTMIKDMAANRDQVNSRTGQAYMIREKRVILENNATPTVGTEGYSQAEQASGLPRNVLELINILTGYQSSEDRNGAFERVWENLNNTGKFLDILKTAFQMPAVADINSFALEFQARIKSHSINATSFGLAGSRIVDQFVAWGRSL